LQYFNGPAQRVFDVLVENTLVIDNLDVAAVAGAATAYVAEVITAVVDGFVTIQLAAEVENPMISAIEVILIPVPIS
jgi:large repetitive protein